jgi:hypothetical protein
MLVVILASAIPIFIVPVLPPYRLVFEALFFLLVGGIHLFTGIIQMQTAKAHGERFLWWKSPFIIFALAFVCFAAILLFSTSNWINNMYFDIAGFLVLLLFFSLSFYAIVLLSQQIVRTNNLRNRRDE